VEKKFERELPIGYKEVVHTDFKDMKTCCIFSFVLLLVAFALFFVLILPLVISGVEFKYHSFFALTLVAGVLLYMICNLFVCNVVYKDQLDEKIKFGFNKTRVYCCVPGVYLYKRTAYIVTFIPFVVSTVVLLITYAALYLTLPIACYVISMIFALHLGNFSAETYTIVMTFRKYKDQRVLMCDTGNDRYFYICDEKETENA